MANTKVAWRVEDKSGFESPFGGRRESGDGGLRERGQRARGGVYIGRENMHLFVYGLVRKP